MGGIDHGETSRRGPLSVEVREQVEVWILPFFERGWGGVQVNTYSHGSSVGRRGRRRVNQQFNITELAQVRLERAWPLLCTWSSAVISSYVLGCYNDASYHNQ